MSPHHVRASRRRFLQFVAASPLFARTALAEGAEGTDRVDWAPRDLARLIADPKEALDVFDFEPVMKKNVPPAHFGYMATGVDDEMTLPRQPREFPALRSCGRGGWSMSATSTCASNCSARTTTARS